MDMPATPRSPLEIEHDQVLADAGWTLITELLKSVVPYYSNLLKIEKVAQAVSTLFQGSPPATLPPSEIAACELALGLRPRSLNSRFFLREEVVNDTLRKYGGTVFVLQMSGGRNLNFYVWPGLPLDDHEKLDPAMLSSLGALAGLVRGEYKGRILRANGPYQNIESKVWSNEGIDGIAVKSKQIVPKGNDWRSAAIRKYQARQR